jgi:hypothetical protein
VRLIAIAAGLLLLAVAAADATAPMWSDQTPGSYGFPLRTDLQAVEPFEDCDEEPCAEHFAFRPGGTVLVLTSVRNDGPLATTLEGVSQRWLAETSALLLSRPTGGFDAGDPDLIAAGDDLLGSTEPVVLTPGQQRVVGLNFELTHDLAQACESHRGGGGIGWDDVRLSWRWLFVTHEETLPLTPPVVFQGPTEDQCASR